MDQVIEMANAYAPEHLEIMTEDTQSVVTAIRHAGAIFVGDYSPVSAGDYAAGSNHVLPTHGSARYSSGLSPMTFLRTQQIIDYDKEALAHIRSSVVTLAYAEALPAHAQAMEERFNPAWAPESDL
jgi:histidinol dehydrogenase